MSFIEQVCAIIKQSGESGVRHLSIKNGDIDLEFVIGGDVALTPSSNLYKENIPSVENQHDLYDNDTNDEELPDEPDLADLALEHPELYEAAMKVDLDG